MMMLMWFWCRVSRHDAAISHDRQRRVLLPCPEKEIPSCTDRRCCVTFACAVTDCGMYLLDIDMSAAHVPPHATHHRINTGGVYICTPQCSPQYTGPVDASSDLVNKWHSNHTIQLSIHKNCTFVDYSGKSQDRYQI
jgi:hypothetical protein